MNTTKKYRITDIGGYALFLLIFLLVFLALVVGVDLLSMIIMSLLGSGVIGAVFAIITYVVGLGFAWIGANRLASIITRRLLS